MLHRVILGSLERFLGALLRALRRRLSFMAGSGSGHDYSGKKRR